MKYLIAILLCCFSLSALGAVPAYTSFRGTGGILVSSNPPIGTIVIDGSGVTGTTVNGGTNGLITVWSNGVPIGIATNLNLVYPPGTILFTNNSGNLSIAIPGNGLSERTNVLYIECGDTDFLSKISNCPNNTVMVVGPCPQGYTFPTWAYSSNATITPFSMRNKTNVEIQGLGMPSFNSSQTPFGDTLMLSNCYNITIRGIRLESLRVTNIASMPSAFTYNWSALAIINVDNLLVENCEIINHHDHGIIDMGAYSMFAGNRPSTNGIVIRNNIFRNIGSYFPTVDSYDGAAITISAGLIEGNHIYECGTGIEPYTPGPGTNLFTKITGNYLENILVAGIQDGGSGVHFNGIEISGNTLKQNIGYTRGGSNFLNYGYGIKTTTVGNTKIAGNTIINQQGQAILLEPGARASGFAVDNNWILNSTNHVGSGGGSAIMLYSVHPLYNSSFRGNVIINSAYGGFTFSNLGGSNGCLRDSVIENNTLICPNTLSGPAITFSDATCSNITIRGNFIRDTNATPTMWHGIHLAAGLKRIMVYDNIIEGGQTGAGNFQIFNEAGDEVAVDGTWPLGKTNVVALVSGRYTNNVWDRIVGIPGATTTIGRTNLLPSAAKYFQWPITIFDKGTNASGTNVWIATVGGQTINGGPTITNIATDNGSMTLISDGANWRILNLASSGIAGGGNYSTNANGSGRISGIFTNGSDLYVEGITRALSVFSSGFYDTQFSDTNGVAFFNSLGHLVAFTNRLGVLTNDGAGKMGWGVQAAGSGNVSSNVAGGITAIGVSTNQNDLWVLDDLHAVGFFDTDFLGDLVLISDPVGGEFVESSTTATELGYLNNVTGDIRDGLSNNVRVVAGANVTVTPSGSGGIMTYTVAGSAGSSVTALSNLTDVVVTNMQSGDAVTWLSGMGKWTNVAPFITYNLTITTTNIFVGSNAEQNVYITTNASFALIFTGTPRNGEVVNVSVSNYLASTIYATNTFYDTTVASNVTVWAIPALSERKITLQSVTNHNLGVARWELRNNLQKEWELGPGTNVTFTTNADGVITVNATGFSAPLILASTNQPGYSNFISGVQLTVSNSFKAPTNTAQEAGIKFVGNAFMTGTGGTNEFPVMEMIWKPTIAAGSADASGTMVWQSRTNENGALTTNMTVTSAGALNAKSTIVANSTITAGGSGFEQAGLAYWYAPVSGVWIGYNGAVSDYYGLGMGGVRQTNGLIQFISSSTGNSNSTIRFRSGNTNSFLNVEVGALWATNSIGLTNGALIVGPSGAAITNILAASATLDFPSTVAGAVSDLPITVTGCADGDVVKLGVPTGSIGPLATGSYMAWSSNAAVYVRFINNALVSAADPASGTFKVIVTKF